MQEAGRRYRVAHLGLGPRGHDHIGAFFNNGDRFDVVALCDMDSRRLSEASAKYGIAAVYEDARQMLRETKPDIFCFATGLAVRTELVRLAAEEGVKAIAMEKPLALSIGEAHEMKRIIDEHGIKVVVSHQLKYMTAMQKLKETLQSGLIGQITHAHATTVPWHMQLGTHFMDYMMWANGGHRALWAVGHAHGRHHLKAADGHFGADYLLGECLFENGVRGILECGYLSPAHEPKEFYWLDDRLTFYGTEGYAWADNMNRWGFVTSQNGGQCSRTDEGDRGGQEPMMQARYMREFAEWLDGGPAHPCRYEMAWQGYETIQAMLMSSLGHTRMDLPLDPADYYDVNEKMGRVFPEVADSHEWLEHGSAQA